MPSIQPRNGKFQLRITHKLLTRPFFHTFDSHEEAERYGDQAKSWLDRGIVPEEMQAPTRGVASPLLIEVVRDYERRANVAPTDGPVLTLLVKETSGLRISGITFRWAEEQIKGYREKKMAPGTIRKRIGALARVIDWHFRDIYKENMPVNVLRLLPKGYSQYSDGSKRDVQRDIRMAPKDEAAILAALAGEKRPGRERAWGDDPAFTMLFLLIVDTGLRLREAYRLRVDQFDVARGVLNVEGSKGHRGLIKPRMVPLKKALREKLAAWCEGKTGLMFPFWDGTPEDLAKCTSRLSARFNSLFAFAGMPAFTEHDLRHEACCRWVMLRGPRGWMFNEIEIGKIMGWSDTKMMMRYASLRGEDLADRLLE